MSIKDLISVDNSIVVVGKKIYLDLEVPEYLAKLNLQNDNVFWIQYGQYDLIENLRDKIVKNDLGKEPRDEETFRDFLFFLINDEAVCLKTHV